MPCYRSPVGGKPIRRSLAIAATLAGTLLLAACSAIAPSDAPALRALDPVGEDISQLIVALDLPQSLRPVADRSTLRIVYQNAAGSREVSAALAFGDPGDAAGNLPPPGPARTYYLLSFSGSSVTDIAAAQFWAREQSATGQLTAQPHFCRTGPVAPDTKIAVLLALPGSAALQPLALNRPLSDYASGDIPIC